VRNAGLSVVQVPGTARAGAAGGLGVAQVVARAAVGMGPGAEIAVTGQVAPGRDVDRCRRVGRDDPYLGSVRDAGHRAQQPQQELAAGYVTTVEDERSPARRRRGDRVGCDLGVRTTLRLWHASNTSAAVLPSRCRRKRITIY